MDRGTGLSPLADLSLRSTPTVNLPAKKLTWSTESLTPRKESIGRSSSVRVKLPSRGNFIRRLNSAPSPTTLALTNALGKENAYLTTRSPVKPPSLSDGSHTFLSPRSSAKIVTDDDEDSNSQDSGCAEDANNGARFAVPNGFAPRKVFEPSPNKLWTEENASSPSAWKKAISSPSSYRSDSFRSLSFSSTDSFDDGFSEIADLDKPDDKAPSSIASLLTGQLIGSKDNFKNGECGTPTSFRQPLRRAFSMVENNINLGSDGIDGKLGYKRPRELIGCNGLLKRRKASTLIDVVDAPRHKLQRSASESAASLNSSTLSKMYGRPDLIADYSRPYALPIIIGKHSELTTISPETLAAVMSGQFANTVRSYTIIDCRYPYEFEGGHIRGAINLFTSDQLEATLLGGATPPPSEHLGDPSGRDILIFHCEFSQVRAPTLYRWLRRCDRSKSNYPSLQYPEVYLLNGGYQSFFNSHGTLCDPTGYRPMLEPGYESDMRKFRARSSSWSASRTSFKRLQLI